MNQTPRVFDQACFNCKLTVYMQSVYKLWVSWKSGFEYQTNELAPIFLRLLLAYEFGEAGLAKFQGDNWFSYLSLPFPISLLSTDVSWSLATGLEIVAPLALILGFMTRFFSAALIVLTIVAIATVHWPAEWHSLSELWQGYAITDKGHGNFKLPLMYLFMLASLFMSGSGKLSIDACVAARR
ncbi:MAG: HvfX family Cu-binding RiPP maturation protein [Gammaproteobacteria bacterium]